jgi:hypothetical protein
MKNFFRRLWAEQTGAIVSAEVMLAASILVIGVIVGLKSVRDSVVTELADVAQAVANVSQSYHFSGVKGHCANSGGGCYEDKADFCDNQWGGGGDNAKCVDVAAWAQPEN